VDVFACGFEDGRNGIRIEGAVSPNIEGCTFRNNTTEAIDIGALATPTVSYCHFSGNNLAVVNDAANPDILLCENWWGDISGPFNATNYPSALGDPVGDRVAVTAACRLPIDPTQVCIPPQFTADEVLSPTSVRLAWQRIPGAFGYRTEAAKDTLSGIFLSTLNRRVLSVGIGPGDTITWAVKAGCVFDTSALSAEDTVIIPVLRMGNELQAEFDVWPVPASNELFVSTGQTEYGMITLLNMHGQAVLPLKQLNDGVARLDLSTLPAGQYLVQVDQGGERSVQSIFKQ
jgi:parallel beta-helix repeat protein